MSDTWLNSRALRKSTKVRTEPKKRKMDYKKKVKQTDYLKIRNVGKNFGTSLYLRKPLQ